MVMAGDGNELLLLTACLFGLEVPCWGVSENWKMDILRFSRSDDQSSYEMILRPVYRGLWPAGSPLLTPVGAVGCSS